MALPKAHRLRDRRDFDVVYRHGIRRSTPHLVLRALHTSHPASAGVKTAALPIGESQILPETLIGISVSQKVSKRAVVRNRIKRRIRAAFQQLLPQIPPGWRLIIGVRPQAVQCEYGQFLQELKQLLADAEVLHGN